MSTHTAHEVAQALLDIEAISLKPADPYIWSSGLKAPIYCDNRLIMSYPKVRTFIEDELVKLIRNHFPDVELIAGTATAGIPHAAIVADKMNLPMIYVRSSNKTHGKNSAIEGRIKAGQKVVMIEDLISTGGSVIEAADKVTAAGGKVIGCAAIFSYMLEEGQGAFAKQPYDLQTLTNYPELIKVAVQNEDLSPYKDTLNAWYKDPAKWGETIN